MKKDYVMILKNALTGEQIRIPNAQDLDEEDKAQVINAYTKAWTKNQIGYYVSYLYET